MPNDTQTEAFKVPPQSIDAEQSVLGGLLLDNAAADKVGDILAADDFYNDAHRLLLEINGALPGDKEKAGTPDAENKP